MLLLESQLRSVIREELKLVLEDKKSFLAAVTPDNKLNQKKRKGMSAKDINTSGRNIKKLWAEHADHQFMSKVNTIHWWGDPTEGGEESPFTSMSTFSDEIIDFYKTVLTKISRRDEMSTMGYLPQDDFNMTGGFAKGFGVQIKGRVTLAATTMNSLDTGYFKKGEDYFGFSNKRSQEQEDLIAQQQASSGFSRRPKIITKGTLNDYILDEESFGYDDTEDSPGNEFVVDNWKPIALIVSKQFLPSLKQQYSRITNSITKGGDTWRANTWADEENGTVGLLKYMLSTGLPIFDTDKNQITEEQLKPYMTKPTPRTMSTNKSKEELAADELWEAIQQMRAEPYSEVSGPDGFVGDWMFSGDYNEGYNDFIYIKKTKDVKAALKLLASQGKLIETKDNWGQIVYKIAE